VADHPGLESRGRAEPGLKVQPTNSTLEKKTHVTSN
jgi:hypothetical protein